jgi:hypothetical protein
MPSFKYSPEESWDWLLVRLSELGYPSLNQFSQSCGINKGTISKYFHQVQRPNIDAVAALCLSLKVAPATLLIVLGAMDKEQKMTSK